MFARSEVLPVEVPGGTLLVDVGKEVMWGFSDSCRPPTFYEVEVIGM